MSPPLIFLCFNTTLINFVLLAAALLFSCSKNAAKEKSKKGSEKNKQSGGKSKKEGSKQERSKSKKEKSVVKNGGSKKEKIESKKEKVESNKEEIVVKKEEEKKETSKKEEGGGDKEAQRDKSKVKNEKKGSKILDVDEHVSDKEVKEPDAEKKEGEIKDGEKKEEEEKNNEPKEDPKKEELKKEEPREEEHKLIVDKRELKFTNPGGKPELLKLNFQNTTGTRLGIKIKCSDNNLFRVNPVFSILEKDGTCVIEVARNAGMSKPDKLSVVYVESPPDIKDVATIFKVAQTVAASKIKCINISLLHETTTA